MDPRQEPGQELFLPAFWTPTDQVIMEDLLLRPPSHDASAPLAMTSSSPTYSNTYANYKSAVQGPRIKVEDPASLQKSAAAAIATGRWSSNSVRSRSQSSTSSCSGSSPSSSSAFAADPFMAAVAGGSHYQLHDRQQQRQGGSSSEAQPSKVSDEERRARHRAVQKRFVQRKKETIKQTKQLARELEQQYQFLQIASEQRYLTEENRALQAQCAAAGANNAVAASPSSSASAVATITAEPWRRLLGEHMELVREFYEPISHESWAAILRQNLAEYELASLDRSYLTSGLTVMGWHDQRKIDDSSVKFVLSKEFPHICARELMEKTWRQLCSPATHAQFFSPVFTVKVQVLQVLSDNARVIHRALYNPQTGSISHGLELLCRVRHGSDFIIFESAVENNAVHACLGASHRWSQMTVSQVFSPSPNVTNGGGGEGADSDASTPGCIFRHGGWLQRFVASDVKYWLMEMFFMALRYESGMVAPIFCLTPSED
ncbi:hypothetical protein Gpo141_00013183 [Globisporangium polare]